MVLISFQSSDENVLVLHSFSSGNQVNSQHTVIRTESGHGQVVEDFVGCCDESFVSLKASKSKDVIIDFSASPAVIKDTEIVQCEPVIRCLLWKHDSEEQEPVGSFAINCQKTVRACGHV